MATALSTYLDPTAYSEEAVAAAQSGDPQHLDTDLRLVRLTCALNENDIVESKTLLSLLESDELVGHSLFKARTAALFIAAKEADRPAFDRALSAWMVGRDAWPGNWIDEVLDAPELRPWMPALHPALVKQREAARRAVTKAELAFMQDMSFCMTRAVQDNLHWLRASHPGGSIADLVDFYRLVAVDLDLKEATLDARGKLPDLIVVLDDVGNYKGSFIAH